MQIITSGNLKSLSGRAERKLGHVLLWYTYRYGAVLAQVKETKPTTEGKIQVLPLSKGSEQCHPSRNSSKKQIAQPQEGPLWRASIPLDLGVLSLLLLDSVLIIL